MAELGRVTFKGASGNNYTFYAYTIGTSFNKVGGVYVFTVRTPKPEGGASHPVIYVGQTGDLSTRFDNHHKADCIVQHQSNCICILVQEDEQMRLAIEKDMIDNYNPPCND